MYDIILFATSAYSSIQEGWTREHPAGCLAASPSIHGWNHGGGTQVSTFWALDPSMHRPSSRIRTVPNSSPAFNYGFRSNQPCAEKTTTERLMIQCQHSEIRKLPTLNTNLLALPSHTCVGVRQLETHLGCREVRNGAVAKRLSRSSRPKSDQCLGNKKLQPHHAKMFSLRRKGMKGGEKGRGLSLEWRNRCR